MAVQRTPTSTLNTAEVDLESNERVLASDESMTLDAPESRPSETKEGKEIETSPVTVSTPGASDIDYPDGGLAAWCVVLGVSQMAVLAFSIFFSDEVRACSVLVPFSQRRLHFSSSPQNVNHRLILCGPSRFGLVNAWGVRVTNPLCPLVPQLIVETGLPILLPTSPHTRDPDLDDVSARFPTLSDLGLIYER